AGARDRALSGPRPPQRRRRRRRPARRRAPARARGRGRHRMRHGEGRPGAASGPARGARACRRGAACLSRNAGSAPERSSSRYHRRQSQPKGGKLMLDVADPKPARAIPFDTEKLDRLMDQTGIDVLVANSKHNVQYLLGGHRSIFFDYMDAMGTSRYLPLLVYPKGAPQKAAFFGHRLETHQKEVNPFWTPEGNTGSGGSLDAMQKAVDYIRKSGVKAKRVGVEMAFLPADAAALLQRGLADSEVKDALFTLERLRAVKR